MNKKGFTLVELLAVIAILGIITTLIFTSISKYITASKEASYEQQVNYIKNAADNWLTQKAATLSKTEANYVSIKELQDEGYLSSGTIIDPRDNSVMNGCVIFIYDSSYKQFKNEYTNTCE